MQTISPSKYSIKWSFLRVNLYWRKLWRQNISPLWNLQEEEEANAAYGYDDDFDDYEDDDFEDEDGGYSEEEKKSQDVKNAVDDSSALDKQKKDTTGGGSRDDVSETEGMAPQQSFLKMSKSVSFLFTITLGPILENWNSIHLKVQRCFRNLDFIHTFLR